MIRNFSEMSLNVMTEEEFSKLSGSDDCYDILYQRYLTLFRECSKNIDYFSSRAQSSSWKRNLFKVSLILLGALITLVNAWSGVIDASIFSASVAVDRASGDALTSSGVNANLIATSLGVAVTALGALDAFKNHSMILARSETDAEAVRDLQRRAATNWEIYVKASPKNYQSYCNAIAIIHELTVSMEGDKGEERKEDLPVAKNGETEE